MASYPFTTLSPVLGVLEGDERQLVIADIPGLIEGASEGAGLGHDFLAHVERTRMLVHVLELAPEQTGAHDSDPLVNYETIERELAAHDPRLSSLPRILALSKSDLLPRERVSELVGEWRERLGAQVCVLATSSATGEGIPELAAELLRGVPALEPVPREALDGGELAQAGELPAGVPLAATTPGPLELAEHMVFRPGGASGFQVERVAPGSYTVRGRGIERLLERFDINNADAMSYFEGRLRGIGVLRALEREGFQPGDEIEIAGVTFELDPS